MPDVTISAPAVAATPAGYTVPPAQEILVKAVKADVNGSGAGSAFLPTLQLIAPSGQLVWESPTDVTVAAGGSATVSWFPRVSRTTIVQFPNDTFSQEILFGVPFAYYKMDDTVLPTVVDFSGNGHNLTNHSTTSTLNVRGLIATSTDGALFLGPGTTIGAHTQDCPRATFNFTPTAFSIEAWISLISLDALNLIATYNVNPPVNQQLFQLRLNTGKLEFLVIDNAAGVHTVTGATDLRNGQVHQVVGVYDGANLLTYHNGVLDQSLATVFTPNNIAGSFAIGGSQGNLTGETIDGLIDEVALYSRAITAQEVSTHYLTATSLV